MHGYEYYTKFSFKLEGNDADDHVIDLYDLSQSLEGLHRTLALTTHFLFNGEIITQAPSLKNAKIFTYPAKEGSYLTEIMIGISVAAATGVLVAPKNTLIGNISFSLLDYVIKKTLGFHVDLDQSIYKQYLQHKSLKREIRPSQLESLSEKCENAISKMHRTIYASKSSKVARIIPMQNLDSLGSIELNSSTFDNMNRTEVSKDAKQYTGRVSSYNANSISGRIYTEEEQRSIPFSIDKDVFVNSAIFSNSLESYTKLKNKSLTSHRAGFFSFNAKRAYSVNDTTRHLFITEVYGKSLVAYPKELQISSKG